MNGIFRSKCRMRIKAFLSLEISWQYIGTISNLQNNAHTSGNPLSFVCLDSKLIIHNLFDTNSLSLIYSHYRTETVRNFFNTIEKHFPTMAATWAHIPLFSVPSSMRSESIPPNNITKKKLIRTHARGDKSKKTTSVCAMNCTRNCSVCQLMLCMFAMWYVCSSHAMRSHH